MTNGSEFSSGWLDQTIHDFLAEFDAPPKSMTYSLITCLDSCFDLPKMLLHSESLAPLRSAGKLLGSGLMVRTNKLLAADRKQRIFFGFDEVWFFPQVPREPKPSQVCLTGPNKLSPSLPPSLVEWMHSTRCSLGLGDGTGMNFVAKLSGIAKHLVATSEA